MYIVNIWCKHCLIIPRFVSLFVIQYMRYAKQINKQVNCLHCPFKQCIYCTEYTYKKITQIFDPCQKFLMYFQSCRGRPAEFLDSARGGPVRFFSGLYGWQDSVYLSAKNNYQRRKVYFMLINFLQRGGGERACLPKPHALKKNWREDFRKRFEEQKWHVWKFLFISRNPRIKRG